MAWIAGIGRREGMTREAPTVAKWLLQHFGCSHNNDAVVGDLDERFQAGRSVGWYWRQVFTAIWSSLLAELRMHGMLAIRALVAGWVLVFTYRAFSRMLVSPLVLRLQDRAMRAYPSGWLNDAISTIEPHWWAYRNYYVYPAAIGAARISMGFAAMILIGWIIARSHAPHHRASVLLLVLTFYSISFAYLCAELVQAHHTSGALGAIIGFVINLLADSAALVGVWFVHDSPQRGEGSWFA
jgi:hypothetical protein